MTERAYSQGFEGDAWQPEQEVDDGVFVDQFKQLLISAQSAREGDELTAKSARNQAKYFAELYWPNGLTITINLPEDAQVFDHKDQLVGKGPGTFLADNYLGLDTTGPRFMNTAMSYWTHFGDMESADFKPNQRRGNLRNIGYE